MIATSQVERQLNEWLLSQADASGADRVLQAAMASVGSLDQDRYVTQRLFGDSLGRSFGLRMALAAAGLILVLVGTVVVGSALLRREPPPPEPTPTASNGLIAFSANGAGGDHLEAIEEGVAGDQDIYVVKPGQAPRRIIGAGDGWHQMCPTFVHSGKELAYIELQESSVRHSQLPHPADQTPPPPPPTPTSQVPVWGIVLVKLDDKGNPLMPARQRVIVEADDISCPAWWPRDAAPVRLAYTINGGSMLRMSQIDGSGRRLLAGLQVEIVDMAWSVDGETLAVVDAAGQRFGLVPIDGSSPTWVALADARDVAWSSDGKLLAAATPDSVIVFDANGGEVVSIGRTLADGQVPAVAWAPDGHSLAWVDDSGTLVRHAVDDGTRLERSVGELSSQGSLVVRGWSPDGAWVLISANSPLTRGSSGALTAVPWDPSLDPVVLVSPDAAAGAAQADWQPIYP